jgi:ABC-type transporter Mla MlaB component
VTVKYEPERAILKLEGKMAGPWVTECRQTWTVLLSSLSGHKLALDLCGVTFVDESGIALLREIYRATRADIITNSPLTKHFADQAARVTPNRKKETDHARTLRI